MDGRNKWNTCCGAIFSVGIVLFTIAFGLYEFRVSKSGSYLPAIQSEYIENFFDEKVDLKQEVDNFQMAIAVSAYEDFAE